MGNTKIKLNEREITVEQFHFALTYAGLLIGSPNKEINDKIKSNSQSSLNIGNRKSVFVVKNEDYITDEVLKPIIYSAWLDSEPINDMGNQYDGSWIVVSWFGDEQINKSIKEIIEDGLSDFDYDNFAQNYQF
ncbi:hypothetical protein D3C84_935220 [compost metagenome]